MTLRPLDIAGQEPDDYPPLADPRAWRIATTLFVCGTISAGILAVGIAFCGVCG